MLRTIINLSVAAGILVSSQLALAYEMSSVSCTVAVTQPMWDDCAGAFTLDKGENDVTNGDEFNIVTQILNEGGFGGDGAGGGGGGVPNPRFSKEHARAATGWPLRKGRGQKETRSTLATALLCVMSLRTQRKFPQRSHRPSALS